MALYLNEESSIYLKLEQGWIIQWPIAFCRTLSFIKAFFDPNNFIANLLSVGAKMFWSWFLTQPGFDSLETEFLRKDWTFIIFYPLWVLNSFFQLNYIIEVGWITQKILCSFTKIKIFARDYYLDVLTVPTSSLGVP